MAVDTDQYHTMLPIGITRGVKLAYLGEVLTMAAIVTTLLWVPVGVALAGLFFLFGTSLHAFVTFGGAIGGVLGVVTWWIVGFVPALGYAAYVLPWDRREA
jgi:hypothetical protein